MKFTPEDKNLVELFPDHENPRIPPNARGMLDEDLLVFIAGKYDSLVIAQSISQHQYFPSEPLIVVPKEEGGYIVVEGNRRLAALNLLVSKTLREKVEGSDDWVDLPVLDKSLKIPVIVAQNRRDVAPIIGYRHIAGIEPWDPYAKARYIAAQIDDNDLTFEEAAKEVGEKSADVRSSYRNYKIAVQAEELGIDTSNLVNTFGTFTRAMTSDARNFIGAPSSSEVVKGKTPIPGKNISELKELIGYLFGSPEEKVLKDTRQLDKLGKTLNSEVGLAVLRASHNLEDAYIASGGLLEGLLNRLRASLSNLKAAKLSIEDYKTNKDVQSLLAECESIIAELKS